MATKKAPAKHHDYSADSRRIRIVIKENPHREGTTRHAAFEAVRASKTVADYAVTGNKPKYIEVWRKSGHIEVVRQQAAKPKATAAA
jgi:hypothetical protein